MFFTRSITCKCSPCHADISQNLKSNPKRILKVISNIHCTKNEVFHKGFLQSMWPNPQQIADLVTFTEENLNGELHFLCHDIFFDHQIILIPTETSLKYVLLNITSKTYLLTSQIKNTMFFLVWCTIFSRFYVLLNPYPF